MKYREPMIYIERSKVVVQNNQVVVVNKRLPQGKSIPIATTGCLLLGPGTSITAEAVKIIARRECCVLWSGGGGIPIHCFSGNYRAPRNLLLQAKIMLDEGRRLQLAKRLLKLRNSFLPPDAQKLDEEQIEKLSSVQNCLLFEARWAKAFYRSVNKKHNISIQRSMVKLSNFMCYGLVTPYIINLGFNPNIGIMHGQNRGGGMIFDIADLIKPVCSVEVAAEACKAKYSTNELKASVISTFKRNNCGSKIIKAIRDIYDLDNK